MAEETEFAMGATASCVDGPGGKVSRLNAPMGVTSPVRTYLQDVVPLGEADVDRGDPVHALDGEIGRVQGLLVDPDDHRVTHVLLQEGHLWGRKKVSIPVSAVTGVENGIRLSLTKRRDCLSSFPTGPATSTPRLPGTCCWPRPSRMSQEPAHRSNQHNVTAR